MSSHGQSGLKVYLAEKKWELLVGTLMSSIGLLVALLINGAIERHRDAEVYRSMLSAIKAEAASNEIVLRESFLKYYESGLVLRSFDEGTAARAIGDPLFVKQAQPQTLQVIEEYLRTIRLANAYRAQEVVFRTTNPESEVLAVIVAYLGHNLTDCSESIRKIRALQ